MNIEPSLHKQIWGPFRSDTWKNLDFVVRGLQRVNEI